MPSPSHTSEGHYMKTKDIAETYGLDQTSFENWLRNISNVPHKVGMLGGFSIDDEDYIETAVEQFRGHVADHDARMAVENAERDNQIRANEQAAQQKQQALASMLITSGFNFDGYKITRYSGYISGDDVVQIERGTSGIFSKATDVGESLMRSLTLIRRNALAELKEAAYDLGCNAVIGVDFDYLNLEPETAHSGGGTMYLPYVFGVTANGNAVIIEQN